MTEHEIVTIILDNTISNRERGDKFVEYVKDIVNSEPDMKAKLTKASGSLHGDADMQISNGMMLSIDGKVKGECKNINVSASEVNKVRKQSAKTAGYGAIITPIIDIDSNKIQTMIVMDIFDMMDMIRRFAAISERVDKYLQKHKKDNTIPEIATNQ